MKRWIVVLLTVLCAVWSARASAQCDSVFEKTFGGLDDDEGWSIASTSDNGLIIGGSTLSFGTGDWDIYLIRTDSTGDTLWTRTYGGTGLDRIIRPSCVHQLAEGGFIIGGYTQSFGAGDDDFYLTKTDSLGDTVWTRTYGGAGEERCHSVQPTSDGGYILAGYTTSYGAGDQDFYVVRTDQAGDTLWTRTYGGSTYDRGECIQQTADGGFIVAGQTRSFGPDVQSIYLVKLDSTGDTSWTSVVGGPYGETANSVRQTADGGYITAGQTRPGAASTAALFILKTDPSGDTLWTKSYDLSAAEDGSNPEIEVLEEGYIIGGSAGRDGFLMKIDNSGDSVWTVLFAGADDHYGRGVRPTPDGGYVLVGWHRSLVAGDWDVFVAKTFGGDGPPCTCPFQGDLDQDGFVTAIDLALLVDVVFYQVPDIRDCLCPKTRADFDCDGFATALDLNGLIEHLFSAGGPPCDPCF